MGINWAEHTVEIEAPIEICFEAIVDYESFPRWQSAVISTEVKTRTKKGLGERVSLFLSAKGQKVDYTLDYFYNQPTEIRWDFVEGHGVDDVDGSYAFEQLDGERTRATYKLGIDPSLPIPGILARRIHGQALKKSVEELKDEAERRHREPAAEGEPEDLPKPETEVEPEAEPGPKAEAQPEPTAVPDAPPEPEPAPEPEPEPAPPPQPERPREPIERAASLGREVAGGAIRTGLGVAGGALGLARGAAGTAIGIGREVTGAVTGRLSRLLDRDRDPD